MEPINEGDTNTTGKTKAPWTPLFRQIFVCSGVTLNFFIYGLFFGAPTVFIPQIRKQANSTDAITMETVSWLFSISSYGSLPWTLVLPFIAEKYGRKVIYIMLWINTLVCALLFYFSTRITELLISGFLQGMYPGAQLTVAIMVLTEYTSPKYRGMFITFKGATFFWGIWISNAIGTFYYWKNIGILIFVSGIYNISTLFWPDSPVWLANMGRYEECKKSHRWLKGVDENSEEELTQLINSQVEARRKRELRSDNQRAKNYFTELYKSIKVRRFYQPLMLCVLATCLYHFTGKLACTGYVIDIIKTISVSESTAYYGMLVLDGVTVLGMYIGVFLNKVLKRRTLLLGSASIGTTFLFLLSLYLYLIHLKVIVENKYITLFILMGFSITISCGPMIMCMCLASELTPLHCRSLFLAVFALLNNAITGSALQLFPYIFKFFKSHGTFLFYALTSSTLICILYKILPETKNRTILEIEKYFFDDSNVSKEEVELINLNLNDRQNNE